MMKACKVCGVTEGKFHGKYCIPCRNNRRVTLDKDASLRAIAWQRANPERRREIALNYYYRLRNAAFDFYGWRCQCCGEKEPLFLSIDHVNGNGNEHRRSLGTKGSGASFYKWLKDNSYPKEFQTLCMNCNHGRMRNKGICPHTLQGVTTIPKGSRAKRPEAHSPSKEGEEIVWTR